MRVRIKNTDLEGKPLQGEGDIFTGKTDLEVVQAMRGAALFSDQTTLADYIDMVLRNAKILAGIELAVKGDTPKEKAGALLDTLIDHGLAEYVEAEPAAPTMLPADVWQGLESVRRSGLTNMFDRPAVIQIAEALGFPETVRWIKGHSGQVFRRGVQGIRDRAEGRQVMCGLASVILGEKRRRTYRARSPRLVVHSAPGDE